MATTDYRSELLASLGQVGASVKDVQARLRDLELDQARTCSSMQTTLDAQAEHLKDMETRMRGLESLRAQVVALSAVAALVVSALLKWVVR